MTSKQWLDLAAKELGVKPKYRIASKSMIKILGWFNPMMKEMSEMLYQYDKDYVFNSDKFDKKFSYTPISYQNGLREIIATDFKK